MSGPYLDAMPPELRRKWAAARVWAAHQMPYLATALLSLEPVVVPDTEDTDGGAALRRFPADVGWHIHLSPAEVARQGVPDIGFWILHQLTHLLRRHAERFPPAAGPAEQRGWNVAADAEFDDDLRVGDVTLPAEAATPRRLGLPDGELAERYWAMLRESDEPVAAVFTGGDCGNACDGRPRPWSGAEPALSRTTAQLTVLDAARRIREHQRTRENVPGGWRRWADEVLEPAVNWRRQLAALVRGALAEATGRVDFTYRKPSRRAASLPGIVLPSLRQPMPVVAMVIDTSASMSDGMLGQSMAEVRGVLRALGIGRDRLTVISADAQVYRTQAVHRAADVRLGGGGGSDIRAGLAAAAALRPVPDLIVALTDGYTSWPDAPPPRTRVVVGLLDPAGHVPEWAHTVLIPDETSKAV